MERRDSYSNSSKNSKRPLLALTAGFMVATVIVSVVVWKVTKDACESDSNDSSNNGEGQVGGNETTTTPTIGKRKPWHKLRLPRTIIPLHYDITLYPDFYDDHRTFYGNETIELNITEPNRYIFIHINSDYLNVTQTEVIDNVTGDSLPINRTFVYAPNEFFVIQGVRKFQGLVNVNLQFIGDMKKSIVGLYKSSYVNSRNETIHLAASKFEPTYARRAFPCFDEPNMKSTFTVTLIHQKNYTALSNMDIDSVETEAMGSSDLQATRFNPSVKMSTYLVIFIVCDFKNVSTTSTRRNIPIRVFTTPDKIDQADYALAMAKHTLDLYETLFEIDYPLPKQDLIAIPDFVSGAMEHWGLITFRESALLYHPDRSSLVNKKRVATVVAHEMAHMWFGNLVTMDWWNDLWLNEGFASYMEYIGVDKKHADWDMDSQFVTDDLLPVMDLDAVTNSHPIIVDVNNPSEITSVFDAISYSKGASVIRMLHGIMGEDKFFQGVAMYLKEHMWGNARTDDLWEALTKVDPTIDVKAIMDTWTIQDGYPYINISVVDSNQDNSTISASQARFMSDPDAEYDVNNSAFGYKWHVSLDYVLSNGDEGQQVMNKTDEETWTVDVDLTKSASWIKFNKDKQGFYRVMYPDDLWNHLTMYLKQSNGIWALSAADRADLLNDAFKLSEAGLQSYKIPINLASYLNKETHYVPWAAVTNALDYISVMLQDDQHYAIWRKYRLGLVQGTLKKLGFVDSGTYLERRLRAVLMNSACEDEDETTTNYVRAEFREWIDNGKTPSVNIRSVIYCHGMKLEGSDSDWDKVWTKYVQETSPSEKAKLMAALTRTTRHNLIAKLLDRATQGDGIRRQDFFSVIYRLGINSYATDMVWLWMRENYSQLEKRFTTQDRYFGRMAYNLVKRFQTEVQLKEVKSFFQEHPEEGASARYRKMALEAIQRNIRWMKNYEADVINWAKENIAGSS